MCASRDCGLAITAYGSLDLKQEIQMQNKVVTVLNGEQGKMAAI
jgi:hypothetical protein